MKKTMQEMADLLNVSKQTVFKYIKDNDIEPINRQERPFYYSEDNVNNIIAGIGKRDEPEEAEEKNDDSEVIRLMNEQIETLKNEIEAYRKREDNYKEERLRLIELLDQQQQLSLTDKKQMLLIEEKANEKNKSFLDRIFKTKKDSNE